MPKTAIPAAGEAMPKTQNISALFSEWNGLFDIANRPGLAAADAQLADEAVDKMFIAKRSMLGLASQTLLDLAAKIVVSTGNGESVLDDEVIDEARRILIEQSSPIDGLLPPAYYNAWDKARALASQLSTVLAEIGEADFAYVRPAGVQFAVCFGGLPSSYEDPLVAAIEDFKRGCVAFNATASSVVEADEDGVIARTYGPPMDVLVAWQRPARSREGVVHALELIKSEGFIQEKLGQALLDACIPYIKGDMI